MRKNIMSVSKEGKIYRLFVKYLKFLLADLVVPDCCWNILFFLFTVTKNQEQLWENCLDRPFFSMIGVSPEGWLTGLLRVLSKSLLRESSKIDFDWSGSMIDGSHVYSCHRVSLGGYQMVYSECFWSVLS